MRERAIVRLTRREGKPASRTRIRRRGLMFMTALLALASTFDLVLRFGLGLGNPVLIAPDAACGYILKPDQNVFRFFSHTYVNRYGMRSAEIASTRDPNTLRIMFVGDSITYGTSRVDQQQIFTEILHRDLPYILRRPVEVLNASASAWAIDNELTYIRSRGTFQSDFVILVLNDGDIAQRRSTLADVGDDLPQQRPATAIGELYSRYIRPWLFKAARHIDAGDSAATDKDSVISENLADMDEIDKMAKRASAQLIVVYVPFRRDAPVESSGAQLILQNWAAAHHVVLFDLTSAELPYPPKEITLDEGVHFNAKGHRLVAQAIERQWLNLAER